jgi:hypothetical protein
MGIGYCNACWPQVENDSTRFCCVRHLMRKTCSTLVITFDRVAWERTFLTADLLGTAFGLPSTEYGLLGFSTEEDPLHVVATPLLPGQRATESSIFAAGASVLAMRHEVTALSQRLGQRLVPLCFVHRHNGSTRASRVDHAFLKGTFVHQVAAALTFRTVEPAYLGRRCAVCAGNATGDVPGQPEGWVEYALALSLVVNDRREHSIYALRRDYCAHCGRGQDRYVPVEVRVPGPPLPPDRLQAVAGSLRTEIRAKMEFDPDE